jgi:hypothetical protein
MVFEIIKPFPIDNEIIFSQIQFLKNKIRQKEIGIVDINAVEPLGESLSEILTGNVAALSILFPGNNASGPAENFYMDSFFQKKMEISGDKIMKQIIQNLLFLPSENASTSKPVLRILEVGAGTGNLIDICMFICIRLGRRNMEVEEWRWRNEKWRWRNFLWRRRN